jgi:hypothetical protein
MSDAERDEVLRTQRTCRVGTIGAGGHPHVSALWFVWDGQSIWLNSLCRSQRWTDIQRTPQLSVLVDGGEQFVELYGIELIGTATAVGEVPRTGEPLDELREPERLFARKYTDRDELQHDGRHAWLRVDPAKIVSWDFTKLSGRREPERS